MRIELAWRELQHDQTGQWEINLERKRDLFYRGPLNLKERVGIDVKLDSLTKVIVLF